MMTENPEKFPPKFFNDGDREALKQTEEPVENYLGAVNIGLYGLMIVACLFLIMWFIFH